MERLPPEVSEQSFKLLSRKDLFSLTLTSSRVRALVNDPALWPNIRVNKKKIKQEGLNKLFSIKRFSKLSKIDLSRMTFLSKEKLQSDLKAISSSCVEDLNLWAVSLSQVPVSLLAHTAGHVRKINLGHTDLTTPQCIAVLQKCASSPTLVDLSLEGAYLLEVPAALLGEAAANLHSLNLCSSRSTSQHGLAVLQSCIGSPALVDVNLGDMVSLKEVPSSLVARAAANLQRMNLDCTSLTSEQCIAVLETCTGTSPLVYLNIGHLLLEEVPSELLKQAVGHLQELDLLESNLGFEQAWMILEGFLENANSKIVIHQDFLEWYLMGHLDNDTRYHVLLEEARETGRLTEL